MSQDHSNRPPQYTAEDSNVEFQSTGHQSVASNPLSAGQGLYSHHSLTSTNYSSLNHQPGVGTGSSIKPQSNQPQNLGNEFYAHSETKSNKYLSNGLNYNKVSGLNPQNEAQCSREGEPQQVERTISQELDTSEVSSGKKFDRKEVNINYKAPELDQKKTFEEEKFEYDITEELNNLQVLLKDLFTGYVDQEGVLSDQKANEKNLSKFFAKYPHDKADALAIKLAGFYFALGDLKGVKTNLERISNPDDTEDSNENAGIHRAYYILQANLEIEGEDFKKARELLKQCWNIPQHYFLDGKENLSDFYATSMGKINFKEGNFEKAEECFKDALAIRLSSNDSRLISSSYNDLALLYIEKKSEQASEYLKKAYKYDKIFQEELKNNKYNLLTVQVDFKRPDLDKTKESLEKLSQLL